MKTSSTRQAACIFALLTSSCGSLQLVRSLREYEPEYTNVEARDTTVTDVLPGQASDGRPATPSKRDPVAAVEQQREEHLVRGVAQARVQIALHVLGAVGQQKSKFEPAQIFGRLCFV